ncbi:hypothetical protein B0H19DRAFT_1252388 [Mycena capillaripes]|nr:hypothetical protein B0H19DRAFT_1252388 [Mycena capillaripes]
MTTTNSGSTARTAPAGPQVTLENNSGPGGINIGSDTENIQQEASAADNLANPPVTTSGLRGLFPSPVLSEHGSPRFFKNSASPTPMIDINVDNLIDTPPELEEYAGPVLTTLVDSAIRFAKGTLRLPTFRTYPTILRGDPTVLQRRNLALELGANGFAKYFLLDTRPALRKMFSTFRNELTTLETVITSVEVAERVDKGGAVYRLQKAPYWTLWKQLADLRKRAKESYEIFNTEMPSMPTWGRSEDPLGFYAANEFEILAICYRAEVENYLVNLDQYFDFATEEIRSPDEEIQDYYNEFRRSISVKPERTTSISDNIQHSSIDESFAQLRPAPATPPPSQNRESSSRQRSRRSRLREVTSSDHPENEDVAFTPHETLETREAFGKSSTLPLKFHEAFKPIRFDQGQKSHHQSNRVHNHVSEDAHSGEHDRELSRHRHQSHLGFLVPNHSSKPLEHSHLKPMKTAASGNGPADEPSDSEDDSGKKRRKDHKQRKPDRRKPGAPPSSNPDDDPSDSDNEGEDHNSGLSRGGRGSSRNPGYTRRGRATDDDRDSGRYFDLRLKDTDIPKWDGNPDTLLRWIQRCNLIAEDGPKVWKQLGKIVPRVLTGTAQDWYFSLPLDYQHKICENWETMKQALADFFLSSKWLDKTRTRALRASYREAGHGKEKPSEYFIRKRELLNSVYSFDDSAVMSEVMNGAPGAWCMVLDTQKYRNVVEFHAAIVFHEDTLQDLPTNKSEDDWIPEPGLG